MADRYAAFFLPVTLVASPALAWALSGDPVRALAVLVVATPCPLILAAPVAILSGVSRAARAGVIVKGGAAIEQLGEARTVHPRQDRHAHPRHAGDRAARALGGSSRDEMLRDSPRPSTSSRPTHLPRRWCWAPGAAVSTSAFPTEVDEEPGQGAEGLVDGAAWRSGARPG